MTKQSSYWVYILTNFTNSVLYVGVTNNLIRRVSEHKGNFVSSFTGRYHVTKLVYFEEFFDVTSAINREKQIKGGSRKKKLDLISSMNPAFKALCDDLY